MNSLLFYFADHCLSWLMTDHMNGTVGCCHFIAVMPSFWPENKAQCDYRVFALFLMFGREARYHTQIPAEYLV